MKRLAFLFHNLVIHPLAGLLWFCGFVEWGDKVHDAFAPVSSNRSAENTLQLMIAASDKKRRYQAQAGVNVELAKVAFEKRRGTKLDNKLQAIEDAYRDSKPMEPIKVYGDASSLPDLSKR